MSQSNIADEVIYMNKILLAFLPFSSTIKDWLVIHIYYEVGWHTQNKKLGLLAIIADNYYWS